jgi:hypothetical protein
VLRKTATPRGSPSPSRLTRPLGIRLTPGVVTNSPVITFCPHSLGFHAPFVGFCCNVAYSPRSRAFWRVIPCCCQLARKPGALVPSPIASVLFVGFTRNVFGGMFVIDHKL